MPLKSKKKTAVRSRRLNLDERLDRLVKQSEAAVRRAEDSVRRAESDRDRMVAMTKRAEADRDHAVAMTKRAEADRDRSLADRDRSLADRDRLARLEESMITDRKNNEGHRRKASRALEDEFAASLPRALKAARGIVVKPEDVRVRVRRRKGGVEQEFDFVAPNGELVLAGEVKTHLTLKDVDAFFGALDCDFRGMFPEYAGLPVHGVVAGAVIDEAAALRARKRGFVILRLEGAEVHPATAGARYRLKAY